MRTPLGFVPTAKATTRSVAREVELEHYRRFSHRHVAVQLLGIHRNKHGTALPRFAAQVVQTYDWLDVSLSIQATIGFMLFHEVEIERLDQPLRQLGPRWPLVHVGEMEIGRAHV